MLASPVLGRAAGPMEAHYAPGSTRPLAAPVSSAWPELPERLPAAGGTTCGRPCCQHEVVSPPCDHNNWSDLRTRKRLKALLCNICKAKWTMCVCRAAFSSCPSWAKRGRCDLGSCCQKMHISYARAQRRGTCSLTAMPPSAPQVSTSTPWSPAATSGVVSTAHLPPNPVPCQASVSHSEPQPLHTPSQQRCSVAPQQASMLVTSPSTLSDAPSGAVSSMAVPSTATAESARAAQVWAPPVRISASGEHLEECDDYEPEGIAMTEEQLDAHLRSIGYS
eukprot:TRINITY_DN1230_c0_g3_i1.p1 TRINITY_DN1230_c0_g3~~TRINITY_DN1230_c0_g3_i1.p1  ORF type:complete len:278 (+),score=13.69 TRINITY_DN1230_c0_g3_i1:132-965(+)